MDAVLACSRAERRLGAPPIAGMDAELAYSRGDVGPGALPLGRMDADISCLSADMRLGERAGAAPSSVVSDTAVARNWITWQWRSHVSGVESASLSAEGAHPYMSSFTSAAVTPSP